MDRFICIHAHFYQPPRENAWLEEIEPQDSAYPYHDWNERITTECYGPNARSRILDSDKKIIDIVNNYSRISFNFGPTLLGWLMRKEREIYEAIIEADRLSQANFSGHGAAIAQCYNHMLMPLASSRDKKTQIVWGIRDFQRHFRRMPEGMWLPETAVDLETLDILASEGIKFIILSPYQAFRIRRIDNGEWTDTGNGSINTHIPYLIRLPSGRTINVFFYDGPISHEVAFGDILKNGENFANRLISAFYEGSGPQLVHIASDGETYGHHHKFGDMALGFCLHHIQRHNLAKITVYGEFLEISPPVYEVEIRENTSWSCSHGIERWRGDCGCNSGAHPGWHQKWRRPLREALDWLKEKLVAIYENEAPAYTQDIWAARDGYIDVVFDRESRVLEEFLQRYCPRRLASDEKSRFLELLEMQRHAMLMYTSCAWFFDEISGLETVQVLQYAARAIQLAESISGDSLELEFMNLLERAPSNLPDMKNGAKVYKRFVSPAVLDLIRVGGHYAISSLFEQYPKTIKIYSFMAHSQKYDRIGVGKQRLVIGSAHISSDITLEEDDIAFAVLHLGDHNIVGGVGRYTGEDDFIRMHKKIKGVFIKSDIPGTIRLIERHFPEHQCSLWHLFRDEQRKILSQILDSALKEVDNSLHQLNERHYPIIQALKQLNVPLPKVFAVTVELMLNRDIVSAIEAEETDIERLRYLVEEARRWELELDSTTISFVAANKINLLVEGFASGPEDHTLLKKAIDIFKTLEPLELSINFWKAQNVFFITGKRLYGSMKERASRGEEAAREWLRNFNILADYLYIKID